MENNLEVIVKVTPEQKALIKNMVFPGCSDDEMALFIYECQRRGVHPLDRKIFPVSRKDNSETGNGQKRVTFQCGIDFFRSEADATGDYEGQDDPVFGENGKDGFPEYAKVNVYRKGIERPFVGMARWNEFYPGEKLGFMWRKMPFHMLSKCAEALAFRKAFPQRLSGLYIPEEMQGTTCKPPVSTPQKKGEGEPNKISEAQKKRFYAIAKGTGFSDDEIKNKLATLGIEHTADILKSQYDELCVWAQAEREPGVEG